MGPKVGDGTEVRLHKAPGNESFGGARYRWYAFVRIPRHDVDTLINILTDDVDLLRRENVTASNRRSRRALRRRRRRSSKRAEGSSPPGGRRILKQKGKEGRNWRKKHGLPFSVLQKVFCPMGKNQRWGKSRILGADSRKPYQQPTSKNPSHHFSFFIFLVPVIVFFVSSDDDFVAASPSNKYVLKKK